jgi:hypothetical protein
MNRGYIKVWRKVTENKALRERGKIYSKLEAWLYLCMQANGTDKEDSMRGELIVSYRYLARAWNWETTKVFRFIACLIAEKMLEKVQHLPQHLAQHQSQHLKICNYDIYNPMRNTDRNTNRNTNRNKSNEGINEGTNEVLIPPTPKGGNGNGAAPEILFDIFWKNYPRHEAKQTALKAFHKIHADRQLVESWQVWIQKAIESDQWQDVSKIPFPATWLNQRRWEDDPPPGPTDKIPKSRLATEEDKRNYNPYARD